MVAMAKKGLSQLVELKKPVITGSYYCTYFEPWSLLIYWLLYVITCYYMLLHVITCYYMLLPIIVPIFSCPSSSPGQHAGPNTWPSYPAFNTTCWPFATLSPLSWSVIFTRNLACLPSENMICEQLLSQDLANNSYFAGQTKPRKKPRREGTQKEMLKPM